MTKTTTGSSRLTVILSWMIALICFVGGALYIWKMPSPDQEVIALQMKQQKNQKSRKSLTEKVKQEQAQRALPANYARQLVEQSEVLVKKNLEEQVKKFQTMAGTMRHRRYFQNQAEVDASGQANARVGGLKICGFGWKWHHYF